MTNSSNSSSPRTKRSYVKLWIGLFVTGLIAYQFKPNSQSIDSRISDGDRILISIKNGPARILAAKAVGDKDLSAATKQFQAIIDQDRNDPESLIYLNNLKAKQVSDSNFAIAVSVPVSTNLNVAQEILRGVAQAQDELNTSGGIAGRRMLVTIADDSNSPETAAQIAQVFAQSQNILGVVGHNSSDASVAGAEVYQKKELVMVSPTSGTDKLTGFGSYIFRTIPRTQLMATPLAKYVVNTLNKKKVGICQDIKSVDNISFRDGFIGGLVEEGGQTVQLDCELSDPNFNPEAVINRAIQEQVDVILLCPHVDRIDRALLLAEKNQGRIALIGSQTLYTSQTLSGKASIKNMILPVFWHPALNPDFSKKATNYWSGPVTWRTATAYDATLVLIKAASSTTTPTRSSIQSNLRNGKFSAQGSTGEIRFMDTGDRFGKPTLMTIQESGSNYTFIPIVQSKNQ